MRQKVKKIYIVTSGYPTPQHPTQYTFVDQLACAMADEGAQVTVITPYNLLREKTLRTKQWDKKTGHGNMVTVIQPPMLSFSSKTILGYPTGRLTERAFCAAVSRTLKTIKEKADVLYGHFLVPAGTTIAKLGKRYGLPSVCAFGESSLWSVESVGMEYTQKRLADLSGIVSVSSHNKQILVDSALASADKVKVFPNGVDHALFSPMNQKETRCALSFPQDVKIAVYTGAFNDDKGVMRVQEAAQRISGLKMIYIGGGANEPVGDNILFKGKVAHDQIPQYLSAADFFILPTRAEGCCNAIIEAMSCGLAIISSDGPYNDDILRDDYCIRVNSDDVDAIERAMRVLVNEPNKAKQMGEAALQASKSFDVHERAKNILNFLQECIDKADGEKWHK